MSQYTLILAGYGEKEKETIGYYEIDEKGKIETKALYSGYESPSFLVQIGNKVVTIEEREDGALVALLEERKGGLEQLDTLEIKGTILCHIAYAKKWGIVLGACYGTGDVFALKIQEGKLGLVSALTQQAGSDGISRAHCMIPSKNEDYAYGVNIATDRIVCYRLGEKGIVPNKAFSYLQLPQGEGPRHMQWHPTLEVAYVITEYSNRLYVLQGEKIDGKLTIIQTIDLIKNQTCTSYGSGICINQQGTTLYAGNRGMDTITRMAIQEDGTLCYIEETAVYGCWPRHIALTQDDKILMIANQKSGQVSLVAVDSDTGALGELIGEIEFSQASFVGEWEEM